MLATEIQAKNKREPKIVRIKVEMIELLKKKKKKKNQK